MSVEQMLQAADAFARTVVAEAAGDEVVGTHVRAEVDGDGLVSHVFEALQPGYRGWTWVVSLTAVSADADPTVNDVVLLPGADAIVAPPWTPYRDRVRPGDLGPGDVLPPEPDDLRLVPAWSAGDLDTEVEGGADRLAAQELAAGRSLVLSLEGRDMAAQRWHDGQGGPHVAIAQQASGTCRTCGFRVGLAGALADRFGVCANGMANDDGRVVALEHGCGAHSGVRLSRAVAVAVLPDPYFDTITNDVVARPEPAAERDVPAPDPADPEPVDPASADPASVESESDSVEAGSTAVETEAPADPEVAPVPAASDAVTEESTSATDAGDPDAS